MRVLMIGALISIAPLAAAHAESMHQNEKISLAVPYSDLNLRSVVGREALDRRMMAAARLICDMPESRDLDRLRLQRRCLNEVRQSGNAVAQKVVAPVTGGPNG